MFGARDKPYTIVNLIYLGILDISSNMKEKVIKVSEETHAELAELGKWGSSMDDIIQNLLHPTKKKKEKEAVV